MDVVKGQGGLVEALNARVYGNGTETLVLSHGFGADTTVWQYVLPYLACYFKVVVFDMVFSDNVRSGVYDPKRYSNLSFNPYAQDLVNLLEQLHVTKSIYLGHSMSAMVGCIAATQRPDLFKHLILLEGSPRYLNDKDYSGGFERSDVEEVFKRMKQNFSDWVTHFARLAIGQVEDTTALNIFQRSLGRMNPNIAFEVAKTVFLSDNRRVLKQVRVPCSIIQSRNDYVVPSSVPSYMKSMLGGYSTKVEILETDGHLPQLTAHHLLLDAILRRVL